MILSGLRKWMLIIFIFSFHISTNEGVHIELDGSVPVESVASLIQGTKLELTCIFDAPDAVFLWTKVDDKSFSNANPTLIIQRVQRVHAGTYTCTVTRPGAPEEAKSVELNILYPPDTPAIDGPFKALKDSTFDVTCSADSNPSPIYWWTYEDTPNAAVIGRDPTFTVENLQNNELWLHCHVENTMVPTVGEPVTETMANSRQIKPLKAVYIWQLEDEYIFYIGSTLDIKCNAEGSPSLIYWWKKEGDPDFERSGQRLIEENVQAGFAGVYVCRVENTLEPTDGPKKLTTHSKRTVVYIVDPTIPEVCQNFSCFQSEPIQASTSVPCITSCASNKGVIAAAVVGWIIAVIAVGATIFLWCRFRGNNQGSKEDDVRPVPTAPVMNKPTHKRNTDIVASIKPDLPKRPLTEQPSEHVYLELQAEDEQPNDYKSLTTDQKPYDYVEPTEVDVKQVNNPRTPPDGFENTEAPGNTEVHRARSYKEGKHEDKLETVQSDNKSNDIVSSESTPNSSQGKHSKRMDSYEDPEAVFI